MMTLQALSVDMQANGSLGMPRRRAHHASTQSHAFPNDIAVLARVCVALQVHCTTSVAHQRKHLQMAGL